MTWATAVKLSAGVNDHYGIPESEREGIYHAALDALPPKGGLIVEIGVCWGITSVALGQAAKERKAEFHAIDVFLLEGSATAWRTMMSERSLPATLHVGGSSGPVNWADQHMDETSWLPHKPIDFLLIDGAHNEPFVSSDCKKWLRLVAPGGVVAFDDWGLDSGGLPITMQDAWQHRDNAEPPHNPHWAIPYFGTIFTTGWEDLPPVGRVILKRRPS